MNCLEVRTRLSDYIDHDLPSIERQEVEQHLNQCEMCRQELERLLALHSQVASLAREISPPHDLWPGVERRIAGETVPEKKWLRLLRHRKNGVMKADRKRILLGSVPREGQAVWVKRLIPAGIGLAILAGVLLILTRQETATWKVARLEGTPKIGTGTISNGAELKVGEWLETDATSRAKLNVGLIGSVDVQPNTRLRLLQAKPTDHRLALEHGTIQASIWAPPRLFFVETPSGTAVDLGCEYLLHVDENGAGTLQVTSGWVALKYGDRESIIPAGATCLTRPGQGPGTPFLEDASENFRAALNKFDFENGGVGALHVILTEARNIDSITLWHLFFRTPPAERATVYDRLAALVPPPDGVTREGMLQGNQEMIKAWQKHLNLGMKPWWRFWQ